MTRLPGLHHVTAIASYPQKNLDFYVGVLGLRLVKRTVNFDDPYTYHFYYGNELGEPGSILTFFPWPEARPGSSGFGQATLTGFSVPEGCLDFWTERLHAAGVAFEGPQREGDEEILLATDADGLRFALVAHSGGGLAPARHDSVPESAAVTGLRHVVLTTDDVDATAGFLASVLELEPISEVGGRRRFSFGSSPEAYLDVIAGSRRGELGAGSVHHVAFRVSDDAEQQSWRERLVDAGFHVSPVMDRQYFRSIYFHEPGGTLFEIATDPPGFTVDEAAEELGSHLKLPPQYEGKRSELEATLPALEAPRGTTPGSSGQG